MASTREWLSQMKKLGCSIMYLNNGTKIIIYEEKTSKHNCNTSFKFEGGEEITIIDKIYCRVIPNNNTNGLKELQEKYCVDQKELYFVIPENSIDEFINLNQGIDNYATANIAFSMLINFV